MGSALKVAGTPAPGTTVTAGGDPALFSSLELEGELVSPSDHRVSPEGPALSTGSAELPPVAPDLFLSFSASGEVEVTRNPILGLTLEVTAKFWSGLRVFSLTPTTVSPPVCHPPPLSAHSSEAISPPLPSAAGTPARPELGMVFSGGVATALPSIPTVCDGTVCVVSP